LGLHRLGWRKGEEDTRVNSRDGDGMRKRVVYLHHGLLMNSEVWVCLTEEKRCLPFRLVEKGYDVWVRQDIPLFLEFAMLIIKARKQSRKQVLKEVYTQPANFNNILEFLYGRVRIS
jgi:Partial alpha/beta-hydrolase lipase region